MEVCLLTIGNWHRLHPSWTGLFAAKGWPCCTQQAVLAAHGKLIMP